MMKLDRLIQLRNGKISDFEEEPCFLKLILKIKETIKLYDEIQFVVFQKFETLPFYSTSILEDIKEGTKYPNCVNIIGFQALFFHLGFIYKDMKKISLFSGDKSFFAVNFDQFIKTNLKGESKLKRINFNKFYDIIARDNKVSKISILIEFTVIKFCLYFWFRKI